MGSYPAAPEAKLTPVRRSSSCRLGSRYAGTSSFTPNSSAENDLIKQSLPIQNGIVALGFIRRMRHIGAKGTGANQGTDSSATEYHKGKKGLTLPIRSEGTLPLENLPVGPPSKSLPYGGKLLLAMVLRLLLFPGSTMESPNTKTAGTDKGSFIPMTAQSHKKREDNGPTRRSKLRKKQKDFYNNKKLHATSNNNQQQQPATRIKLSKDRAIFNPQELQRSCQTMEAKRTGSKMQAENA
ncbi:hypothetical protein QQP08_002584 [Theobroma cacao]|nr:hypothetical protein QQP08_002584 [Theobroma cacao]